ncbi:acetylornithine aminotransferase [Candidatus Kaiserbacteria bacterium RIFCSPHIGHO2_02_FULL_59_21]|uniref:Acetylornithine aminotransferase n=1 Tax=Candidatus Kaiserbacteria bacterium RIFCSPHIGHO2_02_FULL_59_21 TaxID=1798500 RepID=A0A1F6DZB4_9BACT|nr:MAG: acetylornithine aminotransferase [Candidatus Kaiserbacteria bacterium RIFCSPHIGHO2_01_FULL_58_22]OGG66771.1 MAG: acetylornithine aminotransferase [Candidatus Kaiserbacteria bacterium RIFCSPHIGHO2_02_FULL_59_21]OGG87092.1 MAG: acetylornithine aminotransferase [Candidatus Kaiserbacteria bacterium RIFCSPLOWO2_02_FULL_59_19]
MNKQQVIELYEKYVMPTYAKTPVAFKKGKGVWIWDVAGKKYLDFFAAGWGVQALGHCNPYIVRAIKKQVAQSIHLSNNFYHEQQAKLAEKLIKSSFPGKVFFSNSGAEANEAAFKLARKWGNPERNEIISTDRSFHGRTIATATATGQKRISEGFGPLPEGFVRVPFNDFSAVESAVSSKTVAIILEPIQGEGGVRPLTVEYLQAVRSLCDKKNILLIFDEVQTGMGRTGKLFAYEHFGVKPDILTLAKPLGGGFPIGATIAATKIADTLQPGTHGSTFAGSPLACVAALAVFEAIEKEKLLKNANAMGAYLKKRLLALKKKFPFIKEVRGIGLMVGIELTMEGKGIYEECLKKSLLINCTQGNVLRIMPPINVKKKEIDKAIGILDSVLQGV